MKSLRGVRRALSVTMVLLCMPLLGCVRNDTEQTPSISLGVAGISFLIGYLARLFLGVEL